ncbi:hypothetical protein CRG98_043413, partial [Punica granatum]
MPFGLKNAGATYQRAMVTLFHDMMHKEIEVYVDDMIAKSKEGEDHLVNLKRLFNRLKKYKLRLNPAKCTLGAKSGKLLGFVVSERGIEVDPDKVKAIRELPPPSTVRETLGQWKTKDAKLVPYHEYLEELAENFERISFTYTPRIKNQFRRCTCDARIHDTATCAKSTPTRSKHPPMSYIQWRPRGPFQCGGIDVIGPINPKASNGHLFILVAIDYFTKWIEAITLASVTTKAVARFLKCNIIARYGVPATIITDNVKNLNNKIINEL